MDSRKDLRIPFNKVTIIDSEGREQIIEAKEIIIDSSNARFRIEKIDHPLYPDGITINCSGNRENPEYFSLYPSAANVVTLVINKLKS